MKLGKGLFVLGLLAHASTQVWSGTMGETSSNKTTPGFGVGGQLLILQADFSSLAYIGSTSTISAKEFRLALGAELIKSTLMTLTVRDGTLLIKGFGWGHGVGLCQWGAFGMAKAGYTHTDIVQYYYPGAQISRLPLVEPASAVSVTTNAQP